MRSYLMVSTTYIITLIYFEYFFISIHINFYKQFFWSIVDLQCFVQFSSVSQSCPTLQPHGTHGLQYVRFPCPSPTPGAYSNSCASYQWCCVSFSYLSLWVTYIEVTRASFQETTVRFLGWEDPMEKGKATYSSILAWRNP